MTSFTTRPSRPDVDGKELFVNHTLWSRDDSRVYFFARGDFEARGKRLDVPFVVNADGTALRPVPHAASVAGYKKNLFEGLPAALRGRIAGEWRAGFEAWGYPV